MPSEGDLRDYLEITRSGKDYVKLREKVESRQLDSKLTTKNSEVSN